MEDQLTVDLEHLYRLAKSGKSAKEIMEELNLPDLAALQNALVGLMHQKGEEIQIPGLIGSASLNPRFTEEGILINSDMLRGCDFKAGDRLRLRVEKNRITLEKEP